jgi:hypothetical protein
MSDLGRPVDILMMTMKRALPKSPTTPQEMDRTSEADPANINFVGLEPDLGDDVHRT